MATYEIYEDKRGEYRWRLSSGNDIIAGSGEGYSSKSGARDAIDRVTNDAPDADVLEVGRPHFEVYKDRADEWRWRMVASNGRIVADSGEGYSSRSGARRALRNVQGNADDADLAGG
jgi:uncharacterized protein YegP (UPF0339 family)